MNLCGWTYSIRYHTVVSRSKISGKIVQFGKNNRGQWKWVELKEVFNSIVVSVQDGSYHR